MVSDNNLPFNREHGLPSCRPYVQHLSTRWSFHWCIHTPLELVKFLRGINWSPITARWLPFPNHWIQWLNSSRATDVTWHCTETNYNHVKWSWHSWCRILYNSLLSLGWCTIPFHVRSNRQEMDISSDSMVGGMGARRTRRFIPCISTTSWSWLESFTYIISATHWLNIFWMNYTLTRVIIVMLWTHSTLQIPQFNVPAESREKLIQCAPWSFEVTWRNYSWKMKHIKDKWRKSIGHTSLGSKFNTMISHTMSGIWASCWILFKTALRLSQVIRIIFRPSQLTDIIHTLQVKPWLGLELYVSFHGWFQFYSWPILQYPTSPHEHPPRVDGYPRYNESSAAPPDHFSPPPSIPYLSTPPPYQTTSPSESLSPTCLSNLNGTCQSQHLQRGQGECEYSSQTIKHMVPELGWNLRGCAWEQIVEDWDYPDPSRSLFVAMKNWDSSFFQSKAEEVKFGQRQVIALEFINVSVFSCTRY